MLTQEEILKLMIEESQKHEFARMASFWMSLDDLTKIRFREYLGGLDQDSLAELRFGISIMNEHIAADIFGEDLGLDDDFSPKDESLPALTRLKVGRAYYTVEGLINSCSEDIVFTDQLVSTMAAMGEGERAEWMARIAQVNVQFANVLEKGALKRLSRKTETLPAAVPNSTPENRLSSLTSAPARAVSQFVNELRAAGMTEDFAHDAGIVVLEHILSGKSMPDWRMVSQ